MVLASNTVTKLKISFEHISCLVMWYSLVALDYLAETFRKGFLWVCDSCGKNSASNGTKHCWFSAFCTCALSLTCLSEY